eukprot:g4014.t1
MAQQGAVSTGGVNLKLEDDVAHLTGSMRGFGSFVDSFNNKSTPLHAELADVRFTLNTLTSFETSSDSSAVDVDSTYVKNLSKRLALIETSSTSSKEAAFHARDTSELNKATLESLKSLVDNVSQQISTARATSGQVAQLAEQVKSGAGGTTDFTAIESRVDGLMRESEALATRLVGVETWVQGRRSASLNVTADAGSAAVSQATLDNIVDLQGAVDLNSGNIFTLRTDVDINTDDISALATDLQGQISQNKSNIGAVKLTADGTASDIDNLHLPRISDLEEKVLALAGTDTSTNTRLELVEAEVPLAQAARGILSDDLASLSERVTNNTNSIGDIEDDLDGVIQEDIDAAKARITALENDANHLSEKLKRSGDAIICDGVLRTQEANLSLNSRPIKLRNSTDTDWMMWAGPKTEIDGIESPDGHGFSGDALRMRVGNGATNGFVLENSNSQRLFTVRGSDGRGLLAGPMVVDETAHISGDTDMAYFSHNRQQGAEKYALGQHNNGITVMNSRRELKFRVKSEIMANITTANTTVEKALRVIHPSGTQATQFAASNNFISTGEGQGTFFRFGLNAPSVSITDKEVNINGTDVLATLASFEQRIKSLENEDTIKNREVIYLKNGDNNKYVRKAAKSNDIICDNDKGKSGTKDSMSAKIADAFTSSLKKVDTSKLIQSTKKFDVGSLIKKVDVSSLKKTDVSSVTKKADAVDGLKKLETDSFTKEFGDTVKKSSFYKQNQKKLLGLGLTVATLSGWYGTLLAQGYSPAEAWDEMTEGLGDLGEKAGNKVLQAAWGSLVVLVHNLVGKHLFEDAETTGVALKYFIGFVITVRLMLALSLSAHDF